MHYIPCKKKSVVHRGVVEYSAMTWPTRQCIMFVLRWFGDSLQFRMFWGYIATNFPYFVYYYGPTVLWDNIVPLILWMCIVDFVISLPVNPLFGFPPHFLAQGNDPYGASAATKCMHSLENYSVLSTLLLSVAAENVTEKTYRFVTT